MSNRYAKKYRKKVGVNWAANGQILKEMLAVTPEEFIRKTWRSLASDLRQDSIVHLATSRQYHTQKRL